MMETRKNFIFENTLQSNKIDNDDHFFPVYLLSMLCPMAKVVYDQH